MADIIFLSAHLPHPKSHQAGQKLAYNRLKWLGEKNNVTLITFANPAEQEIFKNDNKCYEFCKQLYVFNVTNIMRIKNVFFHPSIPLIVTFRYEDAIFELINKLSTKDTNIWIEYTQMAQYLPMRYKKAVIVCHDVLYQMFARKVNTGILNPIFKCEYKRVKKWEMGVLNKFNAILTVSVKDADLLKKCISDVDIRVSYPNIGGRLNRVISSQYEKHSICFLGAMDREENQEAVLWFVNKIWPRLNAQYPDCKFYIVGSKPNKQVRDLANNNIIVTGFVENLDRYFEKCAFAVAPLLKGAGVKIKVIECMRAGLPVVATSIGAEGVEATDKDGLFIKDDVEGFIKCCEDLLFYNQDLLKNAANTWFEKQYYPKQETGRDINELIEKS